MTVSTFVDPADVATIQALEPQVNALREAIEAAIPALTRLSEAGYPGVGWALDCVPSEDLAHLATSLEELRTAGGDQAALDYNRLCAKQGMTIGEAAAAILDMDDDEAHLDRIEALRHNAASRS